MAGEGDHEVVEGSQNICSGNSQCVLSRRSLARCNFRAMLGPSRAAFFERLCLRDIRDNHSTLSALPLTISGGIRMLKPYKMYFRDRLDFVVTVRDFEAACDADAMAHAQTLCVSHKISVRLGDRLVGTLAKGARASAKAST